MPVRTTRAEHLNDLRYLFNLSVLFDSNHSKSEIDFSSSSSSSSNLEDFSMSETDSDDDCLKDGSPNSQLCELYVLGDSLRYHEERRKQAKSKEFAKNFFESLAPPYFRQITRMDKSTFLALVSMIQDHPIFQNKSPFPQIAVPLQLAATLDRLGHHGNGAALKRSGVLWGRGSGTVVSCMHRCMTALEWALSNEVRWPDAEERSRISAQFALAGFEGCVGLVDGTTRPLSQRPKMDGETYFDRKKRYSMNLQVIYDDKKIIIHAYTGSCQDSYCLRQSPFWEYRLHPRTFSEGQYLLADSAYGGMPSVVAAYKHTSANRDPNKEDFNMCFAKTRILNEHCIGILKSRWHSLKEQKTQLKGADTCEWMVRQVECCVRLHNFVLNWNDEWSEADDPIDIEDEPIGADEGLEQSNPTTQESVVRLRNRVMARCLEINRSPGGFLA